MLIKLVPTCSKIHANPPRFYQIYNSNIFIRFTLKHPSDIHTNSSTFICCMNFQNIHLIPILFFTY